MHNAETNQKVGTAVTDVHSGSLPTAQELSGERPDKPEEACGVFAVLAADQPVANLTYFGLYALQHRGQESAGIAVFDAQPGEGSGPKVRMHKDMGLVSQVFDQAVLERLTGDLAIGHNRYSTTGSSKVCNAQPVVLNTRIGPFALAHNGNLVNAAELRHDLASIASELTSTTDSELIAFAIQQAVNRGLDWDGAIRAAAECCRGAFSLVIGTTDGLFALRDGHGIRPLVFGHMGELDQAQWVVSSETCGLDIIGASFDGDVEPGEIMHFRLGDPEPTRSRWTTEPAKLCVFEMIYFARPDSRFFGESLYSYRVRIGEALARELLELPLLITRPADGEGPQPPRAFLNRCPHRAVALQQPTERAISCRRLVCPYHGWEFGGDGQCTKIPAQPQRNIPAKARVDSYPVVEKYGYVWTFLGDLPEEERPPIPDIPELEDPQFKRVEGSYYWKVNYERAMENGMDGSHAAFVHGVDSETSRTPRSPTLTSPRPLGQDFPRFR